MYIRQKHAILHKSLFLIISSKNYISDSKLLTKSAATMVFVRKVSHGSSFKKDQKVNSTHTFAFECDVAVVHFINFSLLFVKLPLLSKIKLNSSFFKNNFKSFLFCGICKSRYSVNISTDIPISDYLLVHVY